jgi:hypothetical protein
MSVMRPPASVTMTYGAAMSHGFTPYSIIALGRALRHEHVAPEVAEAAVAPGRPVMPMQRLPEAGLLQAAQGREDDLGVGQAASIGRDVDRSLAPVGAQVSAGAAPGEPAAMHPGRRDEPQLQDAVALEGEQRGEDLDAAHDVVGRVDRVDDPAPVARRLPPAELLAEDGVAG